MLSRSFLPPSQRSKILAYSPMLHARLFAESQKYRDTHFQATREPLGATPPSPPTLASLTPWLDGNPSIDRPLFVQFCANDPDTLLAAARLVAPYCDAVDLNLGCPQGIARKGRYGAFLQEDQDLVYRLVNTLHANLAVPVTAKIRVLDTPEATLAYARNVLAAGASVLAVHGRRREQKGHMTGLADWAAVRHLRDNLPPDTVLFANGNVLRHGDLERCLAATGADAVMSAEGHLSDPAIFATPPGLGVDEEGRREYWRGRDGRGGWRVDAVFRRYLDILHRYALDAEPPARRPLFVPGDDAGWLVPAAAIKATAEGTEATARGGDGDGQPPSKKRKRDPVSKAVAAAQAGPNLSSTQAHLFHLLRHFVTRHTDVRDALARARSGELAVLERILDTVERRVAEGLVEYERTGGAGVDEDEVVVEEEDGDYHDAESSVKAVRECRRPWWVAQPIIRPLPKEAIAKGAITLKKAKAGGGGEGKGKGKGEKGPEPASAVDVKEGAGDVGGDVGPGRSSNGAEAALERKTSFPDSELVSG